MIGSPDHLIRPEQERRRNGEAERLGGLEVDDDLEFRGPLHGQSLGLHTFENLMDEHGGVASPVKPVFPVAHEATKLHECCMGIHDGKADGIDKLDDPFSVVIQETVLRDNERLGALCTRDLEGLFQVVWALHFQGLDVHTHQAGGGFDFLEMRHTWGDVLIREVADPCDVWEGFFQQFQAFAG